MTPNATKRHEGPHGGRKGWDGSRTWKRLKNVEVDVQPEAMGGRKTRESAVGSGHSGERGGASRGGREGGLCSVLAESEKLRRKTKPRTNRCRVGHMRKALRQPWELCCTVLPLSLPQGSLRGRRNILTCAHPHVRWTMTQAKWLIWAPSRGVEKWAYCSTQTNGRRKNKGHVFSCQGGLVCLNPASLRAQRRKTFQACS